MANLYTSVMLPAPPRSSPARLSKESDLSSPTRFSCPRPEAGRATSCVSSDKRCRPAHRRHLEAAMHSSGSRRPQSCQSRRQRSDWAPSPGRDDLISCVLHLVHGVENTRERCDKRPILSVKLVLKVGNCGVSMLLKGLGMAAVCVLDLESVDACEGRVDVVLM